MNTRIKFSVAIGFAYSCYWRYFVVGLTSRFGEVTCNIEYFDVGSIKGTPMCNSYTLPKNRNIVCSLPVSVLSVSFNSLSVSCS